MQNVAITLDMNKVVKKSQQWYTEHLRLEAAKKSTKEGKKAKVEAQKGKLKKKERWRESSRWEASEVENGRERERHMMQWEKQGLALMKVERKYDGLKAGNMMDVEAGNKFIEFGRQKQSETHGRLEDISKEKDLVQNQLSKESCKKK